MLIRRRWIKGLVALFAGAGICNSLPRIASAQGNPANPIDSSKYVRLEDQLRYGLRCVTPAQIEYVGIIADAVEQGRIPRVMVNLVYRWALERNPSVPLPYFQIAMRELARRRGITLP